VLENLLYKKILIISRGGIGNVLMFVPTLKNISRAYPNSLIYIVVDSKGSYNLLLNELLIEEVILYNKENWSFIELLKLSSKLWKNNFDLAIVMHPGGMRSALGAFLSGAKIRIGFDIILLRGLGFFLYTHTLKLDDRLHDVEQNIKILDFLGIEYNNENINMAVTIPKNIKKSVNDFLSCHSIKSQENIIGFHPGSNPSQKWKRWPASHFTKLIDLIYSNWGIHVLIFGDQKETNIINNIISTLNKDVKIVPIIDKNITEVASLISICKAFIGNDSGLMHVAVATDVPTFCISGPTDVKKTGPYGSDSYIIHSDIDCLFCYNYNTVNFSCPLNIDYKCLKEFYPAEVFKEISPILSNILVNKVYN